MLRIFPFFFALFMPYAASAVERLPIVIRVVGWVDSINGPVATTLESPFDLTLSITGDIDERGTYESVAADGLRESYADIRFDTDITLSTGSLQDSWTSQFGALALAKSDVGGNLVFDLGTDVNMYIAKRGPYGPSSLDFAGGSFSIRWRSAGCEDGFLLPTVWSRCVRRQDHADRNRARAITLGAVDRLPFWLAAWSYSISSLIRRTNAGIRPVDGIVLYRDS